MLDTLSGIAVGIFFLSVAIKGNTQKMIGYAKRDKAFLQWAVAVAILLYLHGVPQLRGAVKWLIAMAFIGLALNKQDAIKENAALLWEQIGAPDTNFLQEN